MRRLGRLTAVATVCAALAATAVFAATSSAADWRLQAQVKGEDFRLNAPLLDISCPSTEMCVAVGELNKIVSSTNPTGGPSAWRLARPTGEAATDCHETWVPPCRDPNDRRIRGVSCPSPSLCVAVTGEGYVYSSTNPTGSADDWRVADIDGNSRDTHLLGVSCPTVSLCVAVSGERFTSGKILTSTNPTGGASAWTVAQLDESLDLRAISCGTATLCVAVAQEGRLLVSTNPTGGASAWTELGTPGGSGNLQAVSCTATVLCVAGNAGGNLLSSTNPTALSSWGETNGGASVQITDITCLPTRKCVAVDNNGDVLTSNDPMEGPGSWSVTRLIPYVQPADEYELPLNGLFGVSCVSTSFCALVAIEGQIFTNTDPFAEPSRRSIGTGADRKRGSKRPRVTIADLFPPSRRALREHRARVLVRFFSKGPVRRFECKVNRRHFRACSSPERFRVGQKGTYAIRIRAVGTTGLRGPATGKRVRIKERCIHGRCFTLVDVLPLKPRN
ncbi:MAG TPA: hypothetical protein VFI03_12930 [Solirubrobacterales bacterium]|nr:hypothetical protein [Solirubrobacterales bacterium]